MKFWLATSNPNTAQSLLSFGIFSDIVTNPDAVAAAGKPEKQVFQELCSVSPGRVYAMLREGTPDAMKAQAEALIGIDPVKIGIKIAPTPNGLRVASWLREGSLSKDLMFTCIATPSHLGLALALGARWITPWGSLPQKHGGPAREVVLAGLQSSLETFGGPAELVVGASVADDIERLARLRIRNCFVWDKDVEAFIDNEWVRRALATFEPAYAAIDQICPTSSTAAETVESSY